MKQQDTADPTEPIMHTPDSQTKKHYSGDPTEPIMHTPDSQTKKHYSGDPTTNCGFMSGGVECGFGYGHDGPHSWDPSTWGSGSTDPEKPKGQP